MKLPSAPAVLLVAVAGLLAGCDVFSGPAPLTRPCAVVVDGSGSAGSDFHAEDRVNATLDKFLRDRGCAQLAFVPLNGLSDTSACQQPRLDLDPPVGEPVAVREAMRTKARQQALDLLACARKESSESNVLGALRKAGTIRPPGTDTYAVLVVSDMIEIDRRVDVVGGNLATPDARAAIIGRLGGLMPKLANTVVYPTDLSTKIADAQRGQQIRDFWTELLATDAAGHATIDMTYA